MAQQYQLPCPKCGTKTQVDSRQAGETITCQCGERLSVPTLRGLRELEAVQDTRPAPPAKPKWSPVHGMLFSLGLVAALVGGVMATRHFVAYRSLADFTVDRTSEVDQYTNEVIDGLNINESMQAWHDLTAHPLDSSELPPWIMAQEMSQAQKRSMTTWAVVCGVGIAAVVTALAMSRLGGPAARKA